MTTLQSTLLTSAALVCAMLIAGCRSASQAPMLREAALPKRYICPHATSALVIDGRLDDDAWTHAPWTDAFVDIEGDAKPQPRFQTRAKMLWDDEYFYVAAYLDEPHVWASLTEHDQIVFHDNDFEIFIDPDGDRAEYYEIEINALETIFDLFLVRTYIDGGPALHDWTAVGMKSAVYVEGTLNDPSDADRGWSVEFAIPWRTLAEFAHKPAPPRDGDVWRINFSRVQWLHHVADGTYEKLPNTPENNWVWSPQGVINMHLPEHWGYLVFTKCE
ncbi:MAG: carbohydrate-binding family 9-like protein [Phycisphaerales bacterium]|nr:carbohydrate-binding family 9-like protein [Phycisphaerales bacterium]